MMRKVLVATMSLVGALVVILPCGGVLHALFLTGMLAGDLYPRPGVFLIFLVWCVTFGVAGALMCGVPWMGSRPDLMISLLIGVSCGLTICLMCWDAWGSLEVP